jgi:hypothetical protein
VSFQRTRTWKESTDPDKDAKLDRIEYVTSHFLMRCFAFDQFGPLSIRPCHGSSSARESKPIRLPATYHRTHGVRYFHGCHSLGDDQLWGVNRRRKGGDHSLAALKSIRAARPDGAPIYVIMDNLHGVLPDRAQLAGHRRRSSSTSDGADDPARDGMVAREAPTSSLGGPTVGDEALHHAVVADEVAATQARLAPADLDVTARDGEARRQPRLQPEAAVEVQPGPHHAVHGVPAVVHLDRVNDRLSVDREVDRQHRPSHHLPPAERLQRSPVDRLRMPGHPAFVPARAHDPCPSPRSAATLPVVCRHPVTTSPRD